MQKTKIKKISCILLLLIIIPCMLLLGGCFGSSAYVTKIEKTQSLENMDIYTVTYSNGKTTNFSVENGKDGKDGEDVKIEQIFNYLISLDPTLYTNDAEGFQEFLKDYLSIETAQDNEKTAINKGLLSAVSIFSEFSTYNSGNVVACGSGVIYKMEEDYSYVITNYHVVYYSQSKQQNKISNNIKLYLYGSDVSISSTGNVYNFGGDAISCEYIGGSMNYDIAVLRVNSANLKAVNENVRAVDISSSYTAGDTAIAIGNPEGEGISVTKGVVSVDSEYLTMTGADDSTTCTFRVMRIDTSVNGGNSGGGLFNNKGELIGIVNAKLFYCQDGQNAENIAYALPLNTVKCVADNIMDNYYTSNSAVGVKRLQLGVSIESTNSKNIYNSTTGESYIYDEAKIVLVSQGSLAYSHGLEAGEIFVGISINGTRTDFTRSYDLSNALLTVRAGDTVQLFVRTTNQVETMVDLETISSNMFVSIA